MITAVIGVDPGPTSGVALLILRDDRTLADRFVFQCNAPAAYGLVNYLVEANEGPAKVVCAGEAFADGRGPGARGKNAQVTRGLITDLDSLPVTWYWRTAAAVKPWAIDRRLLISGLYDITQGMPHARDACRHALFCAAHDLGLPDPLIKD